MCIGRPAETRRWIKVGLTFVQHRRWWTNGEPTLIQRLLVSAEYCVCLWDRLTIQPLHRQTRIPLDNYMQPALFKCWHTVYDAGPTFGQRCRIRPSINDRCTRRWPNDVLMPGRRRRRWANIQTTLDHSRSRVVYSTGSLVLQAGQSTEGQSVLLRSSVARDVN